MKSIIIKQIKDGYKGILERRNNGWADEELNSYTTGVSNTLFELINDLQDNGVISEEEAEEIEEVFSNTIDILNF
ncbi:hypothetical protein [Enterococcus phage EFLK1]|uniref:Uncharacterized protein n=1 Tax=Enterococcus phage EFLK1 TaxID=1640885 RepID=A0A0E3TB38_9CAUD|nr:hypothetical protein AVT53_gp158 [Enterococcus phage EFLK1]AKC05021.1 hypothetical protein [Enterococcus phage EFLK1]